MSTYMPFRLPRQEQQDSHIHHHHISHSHHLRVRLLLEREAVNRVSMHAFIL